MCNCAAKMLGMWLKNHELSFDPKESATRRLYCGVTDGCTTPTLQDQRSDETGMPQGAWSTFDCWWSSDRKTVSSAVVVEDLKFWIFIWYHHRTNHFGWFSFALPFGFKPPTHVWTRKKNITEWPKPDAWKLTGWQHRFKKIKSAWKQGRATLCDTILAFCLLQK